MRALDRGRNSVRQQRSMKHKAPERLVELEWSNCSSPTRADHSDPSFPGPASPSSSPRRDSKLPDPVSIHLPNPGDDRLDPCLDKSSCNDNSSDNNPQGREAPPTGPNAESHADAVPNQNQPQVESGAGDFLTSFPWILVDNSTSVANSFKANREVEFGLRGWATEGSQVLHRAAWLRPAILGCNEGVVTAATILMAIQALVAEPTLELLVVVGIGGLVARACGMAIGEYISVSSERDAQRTLLRDAAEQYEIHGQGSEEDGDGDGERWGARVEEMRLATLTRLYMRRGLSHPLARQVAKELSEIGAGELAQEETGMREDDLASPRRAAGISGLAFCIGGLVPLLSVVFIRSWPWRVGVLWVTCTVVCAGLGAFGALIGGCGNVLRHSVRAVLGGLSALGMAWGIIRLLTATKTVSSVTTSH